MKVLMIGPARNVNGGISAVVNNYYQAGLNRKVQLTYLESMEEGSRFHKLWILVKAVARFLLIAGRFDIIHIHMASDMSLYRKMIFIRLSALYHKRILVHQHGGSIREFLYGQCGKKQRRRIRRYLLKADQLLVIAPYLKEIFDRFLEDNTAVVLPNSVFLPPVYEKPYDCQKILFLGRLCREKGIEELLEAAVSLKELHPKLEVFLGGYWSDDNLRKRALAYDEWIHQLGWIGGREKENYLKQCNIFVMPSYFEGQSVALAEAMAYSCACIGTNVGGIPQMLENEINGILVSAGNSLELKEAVHMLLKDCALQQKLGTKARSKIEKEFNLEENIETLVQIYRNMMQEGEL